MKSPIHFKIWMEDGSVQVIHDTRKIPDIRKVDGWEKAGWYSCHSKCKPRTAWENEEKK